MAEFKIVINDPKTGKSYPFSVSGHHAQNLVGKKIGDEIDGINVNLPGYKLKIAGGSDKSGFPMKPGFAGSTPRTTPASASAKACAAKSSARKSCRSTSRSPSGAPRPSRTTSRASPSRTSSAILLRVGPAHRVPRPSNTPSVTACRRLRACPCLCALPFYEGAASAPPWHRRPSRNRPPAGTSRKSTSA
jgi:ribosomal protein S6E (S10)